MQLEFWEVSCHCSSCEATGEEASIFIMTGFISMYCFLTQSIWIGPNQRTGCWCHIYTLRWLFSDENFSGETYLTKTTGTPSCLHVVGHVERNNKVSHSCSAWANQDNKKPVQTETHLVPGQVDPFLTLILSWKLK